MNKVILIGHLARDPEMRYTPSAIAVTTFTLAVNRHKSKDGMEQQPDWINCVVWQKTAENCANYLRKGSKVLVEGRIQTRSFDDKEGKKRYVTEVVGDNVQFLSPKNQGEKPDEPFLPREPINISDDDLPF
ncbi:ssDNA-binding protein [Brevibacillus borstelensis AK1]|uniref:Single-stranded DNA-binding protein n=1 Tax=Brevibacillus borstelensis AK1 TaxID=1300222 RepID=M8DKV5_9BACL|nr:single-stranded DNA-binding protein [Brevibacillus borstelensis]EMT54268.1 ssDNA-binding protein [Brevibacillus borstelensis AK1]